MAEIGTGHDGIRRLKNMIFPAACSPFEAAMKQEYEQLPPGTLDMPHEDSYYQEIIGRVIEQIGEEPPVKTHTAVLSEEDYFRKNYDVDFSRHSRYSPCNWHRHDFIEMICVFDGHCTNYIEGKVQDLRTGDICIIAPGTRHAISAFSDDAGILNILIKTSTFQQAFSGTLSGQGILAEFFTGALLTSGTHPYILFHAGKNKLQKQPETGYYDRTGPEAAAVFDQVDEEIFLHICLCCREYTEGHLYGGRLINTYLSAVFLLLLRRYGLNADYPSEDAASEDLLYILQYLQEHCLDLGLHEFAVFFGYSDRQMQRILKGALHMTYQEYKNHVRNEKARELLKNPLLTIDEIAEQLQFVDASHFRRFFRKENQKSPSEYRREDECIKM